MNIEMDLIEANELVILKKAIEFEFTTDSRLKDEGSDFFSHHRRLNTLIR